VFSCWFWFCFIPWRDWFICVHSCSTWRMCKNTSSFMILLWLDMVPRHGGTWIINVGACTQLCAQLWTYTVRSFEELSAWRNWFLHSSLCFQSLCIWPWQQLFWYAIFLLLHFFPCLNMFKVSYCKMLEVWHIEILIIESFQ
jgi:hypothetical protein